MAFGSNKRWIGVVALIIGLLSASMLIFEIRDGTLYGSKSDGMTITSHPITFYISTIIQGLVVLLLIFAGISIVRNKE